MATPNPGQLSSVLSLSDHGAGAVFDCSCCTSWGNLGILLACALPTGLAPGFQFFLLLTPNKMIKLCPVSCPLFWDSATGSLGPAKLA